MMAWIQQAPFQCRRYLTFRPQKSWTGRWLTLGCSLWLLPLDLPNIGGRCQDLPCERVRRCSQQTFTALRKRYLSNTCSGRRTTMCCQRVPKLCVQRCHAAFLRKRTATTLKIMCLSRYVELRNTLKSLTQARFAKFQVLCDIDCRSNDQTPIQRLIIF